MLGPVRRICFNLLPKLLLVGPKVGLIVSESQGYLMTVATVLLMALNIVPGAVQLSYVLGDVNEFVKTIVPCNIYIVATFCVLLTVIRKEQCVQLLKDVATDFEVEFPKATETAKERLMGANMNVLAQMLFMGLVLSNYMIDPVLRSGSVLPYPAWYPFDTTETLGYVVAFLTQIVGGAETAVLLSTTGGYIANIMEQTCLHLDNLSIALRTRLNDDSVLKTTAKEISEGEEKLQHFLAECVERHNHLLRRIRIMDDTYSAFFFTCLIGYVAFVSAAALEFLTFTSDEKTTHYIKNGSIVAAGLLLLYSPCKCGSRIVAAQLKVADAVYSDSRVMFSESVERTISIIAMRALSPKYVTTGGFVNLDVMGCGQAIGFVYTIFTVLHHFRDSKIEEDLQ